jgi:galactonate dehydratase
MKITRIKLYMTVVPERLNWWSDEVYGAPAYRKAEYGVVEVQTDQGLTGLTEIKRFTPMEVIEEGLNSWLGQDVLEVNLAAVNAPLARYFEQAVLDLRGQALGVPVWQLLGGRLRDRIPVTQCTGYKTPEHTAEDAQWGWEHGFRAYKMKCITPQEQTPQERIRYVTDRVEAIHRVLPEMAVRPDIRWRLEEVWVAQELARRLQGHKMDCLESPIIEGAAAGTFSEWRRLRDTIHLPIGDHVRGCDDLLRRFEAGSLDYAIVGGATHAEEIHLSRLAHQLGMGGWSQTVSYGPAAAMGLHMAACMPHLTQPYDMIIGALPWESALMHEDYPFEDGCYLVPERPGLGYTLDHAAVENYQKGKRVFE